VIPPRIRKQCVDIFGWQIVLTIVLIIHLRFFEISDKFSWGGAAQACHVVMNKILKKESFKTIYEIIFGKMKIKCCFLLHFLTDCSLNIKTDVCN